jgi:F0F1-type ATP synthase assembly protein I
MEKEVQASLSDDQIYNILRLIGDVFMLAILKTMFFNTQKISENNRRLLLLVTVIVFALNVLGIYRNSFTLWKYQDFMSYFWLGSDILQLVFCSFIYCFVYMNDKVPNKMSIVLLGSGAVFLLLNIYNFLVNFKWLPYEGFLVFVFWFVNNGAMVAFSGLIVYMIVTGKFKDEAPKFGYKG